MGFGAISSCWDLVWNANSHYMVLNHDWEDYLPKNRVLGPVTGYFFSTSSIY